VGSPWRPGAKPADGGDSIPVATGGRLPGMRAAFSSHRRCQDSSHDPFSQPQKDNRISYECGEKENADYGKSAYEEKQTDLFHLLPNV
jgi:hypothetical protein